MTNKPLPRREIEANLDDKEKHTIIEAILSCDEYKNITDFRGQCSFIYEKAKEIRKTRNLRKKIAYSDIAAIFGVPEYSIKYHTTRAKEEQQGDIRVNGRPGQLTDEQQKIVKQWIDDKETPPKYTDLHSFISANFSKSLHYNSLKIILNKLGYTTVKATPIEETRYNVTENTISEFYQKIEKFTRDNNIPAFFCFNLDEEGHDSYVDATDTYVIVKIEDSNKKNFYFPVPRKPNHSTFLGCINASGDYAKPMIIIKRTTVEITLLLDCYGPDKVMLASSDSGYINQTLFDEWTQTCFVDFLIHLRSAFNYDGPGMMILDNCTAHETDTFRKVCSDFNVEIFPLPPHSSNQTQPLDLGVFHSHKSRVRKYTPDDVKSDSEVVKTIAKLYDGWVQCCTPSNIKSSWSEMGCFYVLKENTPIVQFKKEYAKRLLNQEMTKERRQEIRDLEVSPTRRRMSVTDFNKSSPRLNESYVHMAKKLVTGHSSSTSSVSSSSTSSASSSSSSDDSSDDEMDVMSLDDSSDETSSPDEDSLEALSRTSARHHAPVPSSTSCNRSASRRQNSSHHQNASNARDDIWNNGLFFKNVIANDIIVSKLFPPVCRNAEKSEIFERRE